MNKSREEAKERDKLEAIAILEELRRIHLGADLMTRQQFRNALKRSIGATLDYSDGCFRFFKDNPVAYLCTRNPDAQSKELIEVIMRLARENAR